MAAKEGKQKSSLKAARARERRERKLLEELIKNSQLKCEEARGYLELVGRAAEPNVTKAKAALESAIEIYGANAQAYYLLGECYRLQGDYAAAVEHYSDALDRDPTYARALEGRAACYETMSDRVHAMEDYTSMIELEPENDHAYNMRGLCLLGKRVPGLRLKRADFERCVEDFATAVRLNEANYYALANLGRAYEEQAELERALEYYTMSLRTKEDYSYARLRRGCVALLLAQQLAGMHTVDAVPSTDETAADTKSTDTKLRTLATQTYSDVERHVHDDMARQATQEKMGEYARSALADLRTLVAATSNAALVDPAVLMDMCTCAMLLNDDTEARNYVKQAESVIEARPALVADGEAGPIENVAVLQRVIQIRKAELKKRKAQHG